MEHLAIATNINSAEPTALEATWGSVVFVHAFVRLVSLHKLQTYTYIYILIFFLFFVTTTNIYIYIYTYKSTTLARQGRYKDRVRSTRPQNASRAEAGQRPGRQAGQKAAGGTHRRHPEAAKRPREPRNWAPKEQGNTRKTFWPNRSESIDYVFN